MNMKSITGSPLVSVALIVVWAGLAVVRVEENRGQTAPPVQIGPTSPRPAPSPRDETTSFTVTNIYLTGISALGAKKHAYFRVVLGSDESGRHRTFYPTLIEGETKAGIELLKVDAMARSATVRINGGARTELRIKPLAEQGQFSGQSSNRAYLVGLSDIGGRKLAYFQVLPDAKRPEAKLNDVKLAEGQE
jgi:hypothetical protein